jgi:spore coat protein U-like protein
MFLKKRKSVMTLKHAALLGGLALAAGITMAAQAASTTANLNVSASVTDNCSVQAGSLAFGSYDPTSNSDTTAQANLSVTCTYGASAKIMLNQGSNPNSGSTDAAPLRQLGNGNSFIGYYLYQDSGNSTVWGNTSSTGKDHTGAGTATTITVYGKITAGQNVMAGSYSDTVTVTVSY